MYLALPYKCIFIPNNWFFDSKTKLFMYSDENITINKIYLTIPFKKNTDYNRKLLTHYKKFLSNLNSKIPNIYNKKIIHRIEFLKDHTIPITIKINDISISEQQIVVSWKQSTICDKIF